MLSGNTPLASEPNEKFSQTVCLGHWPPEETSDYLKELESFKVSKVCHYYLVAYKHWRVLKVKETSWHPITTRSFKQGKVDRTDYTDPEVQWLEGSSQSDCSAGNSPNQTLRLYPLAFRKDWPFVRTAPILQSTVQHYGMIMRKIIQQEALKQPPV